MPISPIVVTYWWGGDNTTCKNTTYNFWTKKSSPRKTYKQLVDDLRTNVHKICKLEFYAEHINPENDPSMYQNMISYKPVFIQKCILKFNRPIIYVDCDMIFLKRPSLFIDTKGFYDIMLFNWNAEPRINQKFDWRTLETSGGVMYFNKTKAALRILSVWIGFISKQLKKADDRLLSIVFVITNASTWTRFYWIPVEYFYIPQHFNNRIQKKDVVICHPFSMSDEDTIIKTIGVTSRNPIGYNRIMKKHLRFFPIFNESRFSHPIIKKTAKPRNHALGELIPKVTHYKHPYDIYTISTSKTSPLTKYHVP